jgi:thymidylate synthase (FAD)
MQVKLISYSHTPDGMNPQELVAYCARVSNPANQNKHETSQKLVQYLVDHKHWSPLEMVSACVEVVTTRDIARQMLRHRSFSFQEFSQRYADPTKDLGFVTREARMQDPKNRQNSIEITPLDGDLAAEFADEWKERQQRVIQLCKETYEWATKNGMAKEQARAVLPEGLTESRLYVSGTLRSFVHYIEVRTTPGTQKEHMEVARAIAGAIEPIFPMIRDFEVS